MCDAVLPARRIFLTPDLTQLLMGCGGRAQPKGLLAHVNREVERYNNPKPKRTSLSCLTSI